MWWRTSRLFLGWVSLLVNLTPGHAAFETAGRSAHPAALGGAFTAGVDAAEAVWFNPAGNARAQKWRVGITHSLLYPELEESPSLNVLSAARPLGRGGLQVGLSALSAEDWREQVAIVGYGRALHPRVAVGGSLRTGSWETGDLSHRSWSLDLGGIYEVGWVHSRVYVRMALVAKNITRANISAGGRAAGQTPQSIVLATSVNLAHHQVLAEVERRGGRAEVRTGYESRAPNNVKFRLGASALASSWEEGELDVGIGYSWKRWHIDFAYSYPLQLTGLGGIHYLSLGYYQR